MATSEAKEYLLNCPICLELFPQLKKLPVCKHVFCESCIFAHVSDENCNLSKNDWHCPVCRETYAHLNKKEIMEWVQSLEMAQAVISEADVHNTKLAKPDEAKFACQPCEKLGIEKTAKLFCVECQERFCGTCSDTCHSVNVLKDHNLTPIETVRKKLVQCKGGSANEVELSDIIADYSKCKKHDGKPVRFICRDENQLCCLTCVIMNHRSCKLVAELKDIGVNEMSHKLVSSVQENISNLSGHCQSMIDVRKANEAINKTDSEDIVAHIHEMRVKLNNLLDFLEEQVKQNCKALTKKYPIAASDDIEKLQGIMKDLALINSTIDKAKAESNMALLYVIIHNIKEKIYKHENRVLEMSHNVKEYRFELEVDASWQSFVDLGPNETERMALILEDEITPHLPRYQGRELLCYCSAEKMAIHCIDKHKPSPKFTSITQMPNNHEGLDGGSSKSVVNKILDTLSLVRRKFA